MRILFYAHSSTLYGANRSLLELILGLRKLNFNLNFFVILPSNGPMESELRNHNIPFKILKSYGWFYEKRIEEKWKAKSYVLSRIWLFKNMWQKRIKNFFYLQSHLRFAKSFRPDIIHVNSSLNHLGLKVAEKNGISCSWHHRETVNETFYGYFMENIEAFKKYYNSCDINLFTSKFLKRHFRDEFSTVKEAVIYNGVTLPDSLIERKFNRKSITKFGIVGRLNNQKGQKEVIELFIKFYNNNLPFELYIYGKGEPWYEEWLMNHKTPNIHFYGFEDREKLYRTFEILINNAKMEAFGRTIAEANAYGIPVIARKSGAFPELVLENTNGFLYHDIPELEKIITDLNESSGQKYMILSHKSYEYARLNFNNTVIARGMFEIWKNASNK